MVPLLKPGDELLIDPRAYRRLPPAPGDIIVARHPYRTDLFLVKRVKSVTEDGVCRLEGDNPAESTDSRTLGLVSGEHILGRVTGRF